MYSRITTQHACMLSHVCIQLFVTQWTAAFQDPLSMGFLQARILESTAHFRGSSWPRDQTRVSCIGRWILYHLATWEAYHFLKLLLIPSRQSLSLESMRWNIYIFFKGCSWNDKLVESLTAHQLCMTLTSLQTDCRVFYWMSAHCWARQMQQWASGVPAHSPTQC